MSRLEGNIRKVDKTSEVSGEERKLALGLWFLIVYAMHIVVALLPMYTDAKSASVYLRKPPLLVLLEDVISPSGALDVFVFPSLAMAVTITISIAIYRKVVVKLIDQRKKSLVVLSFVMATVIIWVLLSIFLALLI